MRKLASMCVLFIVCTFTSAAPPEIVAPDKTFGEVGEWVEVSVQSTGKWVRYKSMTPGLKIFPVEWLKDSKKIIVSSTTPGTYTLFAYTGNDEGGADTQVQITFVQQRKAPGPEPLPPNPLPPNPLPPNPFPNPPDPPQPNPPVPGPIVVEGAWAIVVEETNQRTPAIAQLLGDIRFWQSLPVAGVRFYDQNNPAAIKNKYDLMAKQTELPLPVLMIVDRNGKLLKAKNISASTTVEVRAFIKEVIGK